MHWMSALPKRLNKAEVMQI